MTWQTSSDQPSKFSYIKAALLFIIILGVITARGIAKKTVVSASTQPANAQLSDSLSSLQSYVDIKSGLKPPLIYSKAYVLLDSDSAEMIVGNNTNLSLPIASTTKMTTALVAAQKLLPDKIVTVSAKTTQINGSTIGLKSGEKITVANLLKGLLIPSGNDAAFALAESYADSPADYQPFIEAMNEYVKANHIINTTFTDPAGLDDDTGRSTALDLANIARLLFNQPILAQIVSTTDTTITSADGQIIHPLKNTDRLIEPNSPYYLPNSLGGKTGYTPGAGHCLISAYRWQDRTLIGVVMNTNESTNTASAQEMYKLFRWADNSLELRHY